MEFKELTETAFFKLMGSGAAINETEMEAAYHGFIAAVIELCSDRDTIPHLSLMFAEVELRHHKGDSRFTETLRGYVEKAHLFVCEIRQHISTNGKLSSGGQLSATNDNAPPLMKWTGNAVDLVEIVYGISVMGCVNEGKTPLRDMAAMLYKFFGVNAKDCYRFYVDIRRRKNDDRTYFLTEMRDKLNEKMRADDEKEKNRS